MAHKPRPDHWVTPGGGIVYFCRYCGAPTERADEIVVGPEFEVRTGNYWHKPVPVELDDWLGFCSIAHASLWLTRAISSQVDREMAEEWTAEEEALQEESRRREDRNA